MWPHCSHVCFCLPVAPSSPGTTLIQDNHTLILASLRRQRSLLHRKSHPEVLGGHGFGGHDYQVHICPMCYHLQSNPARKRLSSCPQTVLKKPEEDTCPGALGKQVEEQGFRLESGTPQPGGRAGPSWAPEAAPLTPSPALWPAVPPRIWCCRWLPVGHSRWASRPSERGNEGDSPCSIP